MSHLIPGTVDLANALCLDVFPSWRAQLEGCLLREALLDLRVYCSSPSSKSLVPIYSILCPFLLLLLGQLGVVETHSTTLSPALM